MRKRLIGSFAVAALLVSMGLLSPAAARSTTSNSGTVQRVAPSHHVRAVSRASAIKVFNTPVSAYTSGTCVLDLSGIADTSIVTEVSGCGITVTFSIPMNKRTVPGGGWATWGSPPDTEGSTPEVLWTDGGLKVTVRFTVRSRIVGVEAEPNTGVRNITATMRRLNGTKIGKIVREVDSSGGALLFAGKVKSTKQSDRVKEITLKSDGDFAIGRIRVS